MNTFAARESFDDLHGMLRLAVEQIASVPPPVDSAERVLALAAKWDTTTVRTSDKANNLSQDPHAVPLPKSEAERKKTALYWSASAALALVLLLVVAIAMIGGLPREKSIAIPLQLEESEPKNVVEPQANPPDAVPANPKAGGLAVNDNVTSPPTDPPPEKRLGTQAFGGIPSAAAPVNSGGLGAAGTNPSRWMSVAVEATILVSTGGKEPIQLGEAQPFSNESILHVWDWSKSDKSRPLEVSSPSFVVPPVHGVRASPAFSVSPDGQWIVTALGQKVEIGTGKASTLPNFESSSHRVLFSRDGRRLALLLDGPNNTATFRILEFPDGKKLCDIENQWPAMLPAAFAPSGNEIFLMGKDNFVRRFAAATGQELHKYEPPHENSLHAMIVSPSGKLLVSGSRGNILLWDVASGKLLHKLVVEPAIYANVGVPSLAFSPDETLVAGGSLGGMLLWSVETGAITKKFHRNSGSAVHIRFSADGKSITAIRGFSGTVGSAGENLLAYPVVSKWEVSDAEQPSAKSDHDRMLGNWNITNAESMRKGEMWVISEDRILMYAKHLGLNAYQYFHRLDEGQDPKQIDIKVTRVNGPTVGVIKGIYVLNGDELRLCLGAQDQDRPAAFPQKPGPGEVLILQRQNAGAERDATK